MRTRYVRFGLAGLLGWFGTFLLYSFAQHEGRIPIVVLNRSDRPIQARLGADSGVDGRAVRVPAGGRAEIGFEGGVSRYWVAFHDPIRRRTLGLVRILPADDLGDACVLAYPPPTGRLVDVPYAAWDAPSW